MQPLAIMPALVLPRSMIEGNPGKIDAAETFAVQLAKVRQGFEELKTARETA